jgi:hypothetical protein
METEETKPKENEETEVETTEEEKTGEKPVEVSAEEYKRMQSALKAANKESAARRKQIEELQAADDKRKKDELSEIDRLKLEKQEAETKAATAEATLQAERVKNQIYAEASKAQFGEKKQPFEKPEIAYKLLSDEDKAGDVEDALKRLAKENPFLLKQVPAGDGVGSPARGKTKTNEVAANYPRSRY